MARFEITGPDGKRYEVNAPEGATQEDVLSFVRGQVKPAAPATAEQKLFGGSIGGVLRGGRDLIDAGAQLLVRGANKVGLAPDSEIARVDQINKEAEDIYQANRSAAGRGGFDAARVVGNVGTAAAATPLRLVTAGTTMAGRAGVGSALGAAGGALQPVQDTENFAGEKLKQMAIGAVGGAVGTPIAELVMRGGAAAVNSIGGALKRGAPLTAQQADNLISQALEQQGVKWASLGEDVKAALRSDVTDALQVGGQLDEVALRRLADIRAVGATPTRGAVTLDPVQVTKERNLAKFGANSSDPAVQRMARVENENNRALIDRLNALQGGGTADEFATGAKVIGALKDRDAQAASTVRRLYGEAENLNAGQITMDGAGFVNRASQALDETRRGAFLPAEIRTVMQGVMERAQKGVPMTINDAEQLRTILATASRSTQDGNVRAAIASVRDALEGTQPTQLAGQQATEAFAKARGAHAARMAMQDESPALAAALDGAQPDRFVRQFILGGGSTAQDVAALRRMATGSPEALDAVRGQIVAHLKSKALNQATDEVGTFSQSAFNKALKEIGDKKLGVFFSPEEIAQLQQVGRAASYLQVQPKGSAVNNSNTASAAFSLLDRLVSRVPFGDAAVRQPVNNLLQQRAARNALEDVLPVTGRNALIDEARLQNALRLAPPVGGALGITAAQ